MALRPQSHEIIRTWAFYTILKSLYHFDKLPWKSIAISGWGLAPEGAGKISKSRGGGPIAPLNLIQEYSADAVRYWAASTGLGKDSVINIEKVQIGAKLVNKLWNVARFSERFLTEYHVPHTLPILSIADQWILSSTQNLIRRITQLFEQNDYAAAKSEIESFFWRELADNYLEMAKQRLYNEENPSREGALYTLHRVLLTTVKLLAPILPYVTDQIYQGLFATQEGIISVHRATWPCLDDDLVNETANAFGDILIEIATTVRRYKSDHQLPLTTELRELHLITGTSELAQQLEGAREDLMSITRTQHIDIDTIHDQSGLRITIEL